LSILTNHFVKNILLLILFALLQNVLQAQPPQAITTPSPENSIHPGTEAGKGKGRIVGTLKDSVTGETVQYATISLNITSTQIPVNGTVTDEKGKFSIAKIEPGDYTIVISFLGYKDKVINNLSITDKSDTDLGTLRLSPSVFNLKEVTVSGERALIEEKVDRTVYNAENDASNRGGDATDVLRKVPMLSVDMDGNVSLRGNQNLRVLINNKPSAIAANSVADALKQIPADMIKSVEVITSPSSKYDAEGSAGIINIITKKNTLDGFSLNVDGSAGVRGSSLGLNGSYRKGKMGFSLGGHGRYGYNITGKFSNDQLTENQDGSFSRTTQQASTRSIFGFGQYQLGWDYEMSKKNSLSATVKYGFRNSNNYQDHLNSFTYRNDTLQNHSIRNANVGDLSNTVDASLNFTHTFEKPQKEFSILTLYSRNDRNNDFYNAILDNDFTVIQRLKNKNESYNQESTIQLDYQSPLGKNQLVELGTKNIYRQVLSNYSYYQSGGQDGAFIPSVNQNLSNNFHYNQNVTAAYVSYTFTLPHAYTVKAGGRYEYTMINARFQNNETIHIPSYSILVPSLNISKKLKNGNMVKASFNRRIQRPSLQFLNPNLQASNPLNVSIGNPLLQPEFTNNYELAYSAYFKNTSLSVSGFIRNTGNAIQSVRDIQGQDTIRTTFQNIGSQDAYGFSIFANVNLANKFTLNGGPAIYYAIL
jgi:outer membrane receptor protein involved in Fe transport